MSAKTVSTAQDRVKELRGKLKETAAEIKAFGANMHDETGKGHFVVGSTDHKSYLDAIKRGEEIQSMIVAEEKAAGIFAFLESPDGVLSTAGADASATARLRGLATKTLGQEWLESDAYQEMKSSGWKQLGQTFSLDRSLHGPLERKDVYSAMGGTIDIPSLGSAQNLGYTERVLRPGRVRDLFPAESTTAAILYGIRHTGFVNNARPVPERVAADGISPPTGGPTDIYALKPRSSLTLVPVTYPIATIAHVDYAHRNTLADEPRMRGIIDRDMIDGVKMAEDEQILWGDGIGDNLTGIFNTPGIQAYTGLAADKRSAQIRRAATLSYLAFFPATGIVMHPLDWEDIELEQDNNGAYTIAVSVAVGGEKRVWRMNVVDTPAMIEGRCLLGAFGTGAKLYDREQVNVVISTENRDMFERNAVTIRAEERVGLVVDRPESFVDLELTEPAVP